MHDITDLPAWERLFKKIVWKQLGDMEGKKILDFGSGEGITANHFAEKNDVTALSAFKNEIFDMIICHNVLEYIDDKAAVIKALARVLKKDGIMDKYLRENGYVNDFTDERHHHEIYLSDPRKVAPERCKTVIRHPIKKL